MDYEEAVSRFRAQLMAEIMAMPEFEDMDQDYLEDEVDEEVARLIDEGWPFAKEGEE